jgi:tetratricopeptide (TPR) repeat protein
MRYNVLACRLALAAALFFGVCWTAIADTEWADCSSADTSRIIQGCSAILAKTSKIPLKQRAVAYVNRGIAYYDRGELEKALADYSAAIRSDPVSSEAYHNRADLELHKGDLLAAIADYTKSIDLNSKSASAYNGRGNALRESGKIDRAIADYDLAIKLDPKSPFPYNGRGNVWRDKGELDRAIEDYSHALALDPKYTTALIGRANAFSDKADWQKAIKDYNSAIALAPQDATAYNNRGAAYQNNRNFDQAIDDYDRALAIDPTRSSFYFNRALAYHLKGELDRALQDYTATIQRDASYAFAYHNRGLILYEKGEFDQAIADYTRAIQVNPIYAQSLTSRGIAILRKGDARKALDDLNASLRLDDRQPSASIALGEAFGQLKMYDDAMAQLNRAIAESPDSSEAYFQRGRVFEARGESAQAAKDFETVRALDPTRTDAREALQRAKVARLDKPASVSRLNRVALVIANSKYQRFGQLLNPKRDGAAIAEAFQRVGFRQVVVVEDQTREQLLAALRSFRELADPAEWAVIYYAGHGIEIDGVNYIVPVDAKLVSDRDVQDEAITLSRVLDTVERSTQLKLVILDACRENPFLSQMKISSATRSIGRGLARVEPEGSTLVAYSAKSGQVALDGTGETSPFVNALVGRILTPGLEIRKLFGLVRDDVLMATGSKQEPSIYGSLGGDDYIINPR